MFHCIKRTPNTLFHFTFKSNVDNITKDMCIKKFKDSHTWFFEKLEDVIEYFDLFMMSDNYRYMGFDGLPHGIINVNKSDYVILKFKARYSDPLNWFIYEGYKPPNIDKSHFNDPYENSVAYKGNLKLKNIEIIPFP